MKPPADLAGRSIKVVVSDPWDFVTSNGSGPFLAVIERVKDDRLLVRLDVAVHYEGQVFEYLVAIRRTVSDDFVNLTTGGRAVNCGLIGVPGEVVQSGRAFDLSWWRGGLALLGTICSPGGGGDRTRRESR